jgi:hypothetical protein
MMPSPRSRAPAHALQYRTAVCAEAARGRAPGMSDGPPTAVLASPHVQRGAARACESLSVTASLEPATLSPSFFLRELVDTLMRQPQETSSVARALLQLSGSQYADRASSRAGCASVLFVGLLAKCRVRSNRPCRGTRQLHVAHDRGRAGIVDEQLQRLSDAAPSLVDGAALRVAAAYTAHGGHPPARLVSLVGHAIALHGFFNHPFPRHGSNPSRARCGSSRPGPMSSPA